MFARNLEPDGLGMVNRANREITVPFVAWSTRNFKPEYLVEWKAPKDSIEHTFIECPFTTTFVQKVIQWFNQTNLCQIFPTTEEVLFGIFSSACDARIKKKFNYTTLAMRHYIYASKTNSKTISIHEFIDKLLVK